MQVLQTLSWKEVQYASKRCQLPIGRWGHKLIAISNNQLLMFGGFGGDSTEGQYLDDLWVFDATTLEWQQWQVSDQAPQKRSNYSLHYNSVDDEVIMFGGGTANKGRFSDVWVLSLVTKSWRKVEFGGEDEIPWQRTYHVSQFRYPYLIVHGGEGVANLDLDDTWVLHFPSRRWKKLSFEGAIPEERRFHGSVLHKDYLYIFGGCHQNYRLLDDIHRVDLGALFNSELDDQTVFKWEALPSNTGALHRWGHSCVLFEGRVYIWGGRVSATKDTNDLLVYDLQEHSLKSVRTEGHCPLARRRHSGLVMGRSMLVFGGYSGQYYSDFHFITLPNGFPKASHSYQVSVLEMREMEKLLDQCESSIQKGITVYVKKQTSTHSLKLTALTVSSNLFFKFMARGQQSTQVQLPSFTSMLAFRTIINALHTQKLLLPKQSTLHQQIDLASSLQYFGCQEMITSLEQHLLASPLPSQPQKIIELTQNLPMPHLRQHAAVSLLLKQPSVNPEISLAHSTSQLRSSQKADSYLEEVEGLLRFQLRQKAMQSGGLGLLARTTNKMRNMILGGGTPEEGQQLGCWHRVMRALAELCGGGAKQ